MVEPNLWTERKMKSSEELQTEFMQYSGMDKVLVADELVTRGEELFHSKGMLSRCIGSLNLEELKALDAGWQLLNFSVYLEVHGVLMKKQRRSDSTCWIQRGDEQLSVHPRKLLHENYHSVWKEGQTNWKPKSEIMDWLIYRDIKEMSFRQEEVIIEDSKSRRSSSAVVGILSFVAVPYWTIMFFVALYYSFSSIVGPGLPLAFSAFMIVMSAPIGIGLMSGAAWAHRMFITTGFVAILWFLSHIVLQQGNWVWLLMMLYQIAILLPIIAKEFGPFQIKKNSF